MFVRSSVTLSVTYLCEWMDYEWVSLIVIFELTSWLTHLKLRMSLEWMMMLPMRVDVDFHSCDLKLEVHRLRYTMHCSFTYSDWEFRHVYNIIHECAWTFWCCGLRAVMIYLFMSKQNGHLFLLLFVCCSIAE